MKAIDAFNRILIGLLPILIPLYILSLLAQFAVSNISMFGEPYQMNEAWVRWQVFISTLPSLLFGLVLAGGVLVLVGVLLELKSRTN